MASCADRPPTPSDRFRFEYDAVSGVHTYRVIDVPAISETWSLDVGEIAYGLRSALDHLAWQLVLLDGGTPGRSTAFPVMTTPRSDKEGRPVYPDLVPPLRRTDIRRAIDEHQPYRLAVHGEQYEDVAPRSLLWMLNELCNIDKHRQVLVVACAVDLQGAWWSTPVGATSPEIEIVRSPITDQMIAGRFDFHGDRPPRDFEAHLGIQFVLDEPTLGAVRGRDVVGLLETLHAHVRWTILESSFAPVFRSLTRRRFRNAIARSDRALALRNDWVEPSSHTGRSARVVPGRRPIYQARSSNPPGEIPRPLGQAWSPSRSWNPEPRTHAARPRERPRRFRPRT